MSDLCNGKLRGKNADGIRKEGTCRRPAGWGTDHFGVGRCKMHLGSTQNLRIHAAELQVTQDAQKLLGQLNITPVEDPLTELAKLAGEVTAWKNVIAQRVAFLDDIRYDGEKTGEQIRGEVIVFERALDRCNTVLSSMARLNIDERLARVSEVQARVVADALSAVLGEMGLNIERQQEAKTRVAEKLRLIAG